VVAARGGDDVLDRQRPPHGDGHVPEASGPAAPPATGPAPRWCPAPGSPRVCYTCGVTLVSADLVFAEDRWRSKHAFVMQGGRILATGERSELAEQYADQEREDWGEVAVLPGTVNGHGHSFQVLLDRKSTRLNSSHVEISYAVFCLKKK